VTRDRIRALGRGEEAPLVDSGRSTPTRAERARNRRTELVIEPAVETVGDAAVDNVQAAGGSTTFTAVNGSRAE
jgi:hypothetical protein